MKLFLSWLFKFTLIKNNKIKVGARSRVVFWRIRTKTDNMLVVGDNSIVETKVVFERPFSCLKIGSRSFLGCGLITVAGKVIIGNDVMVAWGGVISDHNSHSVRFSERKNDICDWLIGKKDWSNVASSPTVICDKAWVGFNAVILKGVTIGEGAIVGAGSVVTKNIPPWTIAAGNPAKVIREIALDER